MKPRILDSGAHALYNLMQKKHKGGKLNYSDYKSKEFWSYCDSYAAFIKKYGYLFDGGYITVDAIRNPRISWQVQKYLEEEHGLNPIPVIHFGTHEKWLQKYLDAGYDYIGLGGSIERKPYTPWADRMWDIICDTPNRLPICKVHGFAQTKVQIMTMYPWYSVDSVTSKKMAYYSQIIMPSRISGKYSWNTRFLSIFMDDVSPYTERNSVGKGRHFSHLSPPEKQSLKDWLDFIEVPLGERRNDGTIRKLGVTNSKQERVAANIKFLQWIESKVPKWPWSYLPEKSGHRKSLEGLI